MLELVEDGIRIAVAVLSAFIFVVGVAAYRRRPTRRMLMVLVLFSFFLLQGILLVVEVTYIDTELTESLYYAFQFVELALIALILLAR